MRPSTLYSEKTADGHQAEHSVYDRPDHDLRRSSQPVGLRPIDILACLDQEAVSSSKKVTRAIDLLASMDVQNASRPSARPIDILALLEQNPSSSSAPSQVPSAMRPIDLLNLLSTGSQPDLCHHEIPLPSSSRPIARLPRRALPLGIAHTTPTAAILTHSNVASQMPKSKHLHTPTPITPQADESRFLDLTVDISQADDSTFLDLTADSPKANHSTFLDLTADSPKADHSTFLDLTADTPIRRPSTAILEIKDSSEESDNPKHEAMDVDMDAEIDDENILSRQKYIFNTNDPVDTRHTALPWIGSLRPEDWIPSREELHADQVDYDRSLPSEMIKAGHPLYAISPGDMESMHRFLMARYQVSDFEDYRRLLALLRNTRAIQAQKARERHADLLTLQTTVEAARHRLHALK